ncbi:MAG: hypothetical protein OXE93_00230 [bacterium]|nr:hypothetical protein [bacterium]
MLLLGLTTTTASAQQDTVAQQDTGTGTGTITDDDTAPAVLSLRVSPTSVSEDVEVPPSITVVAILGGTTTFATDTLVAVQVGREGDTAVSGTDYAAVSDFLLTIPADTSSASGNFTLALVDDNLVEETETLTVHGTATGLVVREATIMIIDNDSEEITPVPTPVEVVEVIPPATQEVLEEELAYTGVDTRLLLIIVATLIAVGLMFAGAFRFLAPARSRSRSQQTSQQTRR